MKLLVVSYRIHPDPSAEGINTAKLIGALRGAGHEVTLVTSDHNELPDGVDRPRTALFEDVHVVRCPGVRPARWLGPARGLWPAATGLPVEAWGWIRRASEAAERLWREERFDFLYTRAMRFWSHVVGLRLKRRLDVPWVAHFNDPWPASLHPRAAGQPPPVTRSGETRRRALVGRVLDRADALTFPSRLLAEHLLAATGRPRHLRKIHVVPHLMIDEDATPSPAESTRLVLLHAGSLRGPRRPGMPGRNAAALVEGLRRFLADRPDARGRIVVDLLGHMDPTTRAGVEGAGLGDTVRLRERVPYERLPPLLRAASALLLLDVDLEQSPYPPSKLPDYLAARRPIVALTPARSDVRESLGEGGAIYALPHDAASIAEALARTWDSWRAGTLHAHVPAIERRRPFLAESIVRTLEEIAQVVRRA